MLFQAFTKVPGRLRPANFRTPTSEGEPGDVTVTSSILSRRGVVADIREMYRGPL